MLAHSNLNTFLHNTHFPLIRNEKKVRFDKKQNILQQPSVLTWPNIIFKRAKKLLHGQSHTKYLKVHLTGRVILHKL